MTYPRLVARNGLTGNYAETPGSEAEWKRMIAGDLRRLERDARDEIQVARLARRAGVSEPQALAVLDAHFADCAAEPPPWLGAPFWPAPPRPSDDELTLRLDGSQLTASKGDKTQTWECSSSLDAARHVLEALAW